MKEKQAHRKKKKTKQPPIWGWEDASMSNVLVTQTSDLNSDPQCPFWSWAPWYTPINQDWGDRDRMSPGAYRTLGLVNQGGSQ